MIEGYKASRTAASCLLLQQLLLPSLQLVKYGQCQWQALKKHAIETAEWVVPQKGRPPLLKLYQWSPVPLNRAQSFYQSCWHQLLSLSHSLLARDDRAPTTTHIHPLFPLLTKSLYTTQAHSIRGAHRHKWIYYKVCDQGSYFSLWRERQRDALFPHHQKELGSVRNRHEALKMAKAYSKNHFQARSEPVLTKLF